MLTVIAAVAVAYTVEDFMGYTDRHQLTAGDASTVYWVEKKKGVPNIFRSSFGGSVWETAQITQYTLDDGSEITILGATRDDVYYNIGAMDGVNAYHRVSGAACTFNSASLQSQVQQMESCVDAVIVGPNGVEVFWSGATNPGTTNVGHCIIAQNQRCLQTATGLFSVTGSVSSFTLSPDGAILAFQNDRAEHGFIGIYVMSASRVQYVAPSYDADVAPLWMNNTLCWRRIRDMTGTDGRDTRCARYQYCQGEPAFMIMAADYSMGPGLVVKFTNVRKLYENYVTGYPEAAGYGVKAMMAVGNEILFGTEEDNHVKVVAVDVTSLAKRVLTPNACDNQAWMAAGTTLYTSNNCDNIDSLGITATDIKTLQTSSVFKAQPHAYAGITESGGGMAVTTGGLVYLYCTWNTSCVFQTDKAVLSKDTFDGTAVGYVMPELTTFQSEDGVFTLHAQVFKPKNPNGKGVLFTHGGSHRQMYAAIHYARDYSNLYAQNQYLASLGFQVMSLNYRGGVGYGVKFRACWRCGWLGAAEYNDVMTGGIALNTAFGVGNVFVHGLSYGGLNAMQAITRNSDLFSAGVANAPVYNWVSVLRFGAVGGTPFDQEAKMDLGFRTLGTGPYPDLAGSDWAGYVQSNIQLAWSSSPAGHVSSAYSPLLIIQGDADDNVDFAETLGAVRALRRIGYPESHLETLVFPDENHALSLFTNDVIAAEHTAAFLLKHANLTKQR